MSITEGLERTRCATCGEPGEPARMFDGGGLLYCADIAACTNRWNRQREARHQAERAAQAAAQQVQEAPPGDGAEDGSAGAQAAAEDAPEAVTDAGEVDCA